MKSLLTIGALKEVELLDPKTKRTEILRPSGVLLAWDPENNKKFYICKKINQKPKGSLSSKVQNAHGVFHNKAPAKKPIVADNPSPKGKLKQLGLIKSLVYFVPNKIKSPNKNKHLWHHAFGDTGHKGGSDYPTSVMPMLMEDSVGNWFIKRRKGNIYSVDEWLRG